MTGSLKEKINRNLLNDEAEAVAVSSCTAVRIRFDWSKIERGDEVIVFALTFVSDFNVVKALGANPFYVMFPLTEWSPS